MKRTGRFDTDAAALARRIQINETYGSVDFDRWVFQHLELANGLSVLDLGCGTGKHTIPLCQLVGSEGRVTAFDISEQALAALSTRVKEAGVETQITIIKGDFDDVDTYLHGESFDRVLSSYALYYAKHPSKVLRFVHSALKPGGLLLFCGPARDNNRELRELHFTLQGKPFDPGTEASVFMEETGRELAYSLFSRVEIVELENTVRLDSADGLLSYWSSRNLYDENIAEAFRTAANRHFEAHSSFEIKKCITGVKAMK